MMQEHQTHETLRLEYTLLEQKPELALQRDQIVRQAKAASSSGKGLSPWAVIQLVIFALFLIFRISSCS